MKLALAVLSLAAASMLASAGTAQAARVTSVTVGPSGITLAPGQTARFKAISHFDDGSTQDISGFAEWTTSDGNKAKISDDTNAQGRLVTARDPGQVEIRAALIIPDPTDEDGIKKIKGFVVLTVFAGDPVGIVTRPTTKVLDVGRPAQFRAKRVYEDGYEADITDTATWSSLGTLIATVSNVAPTKGLVMPVAIGGTNIVAYDPETGFSNTLLDSFTEVKSRVLSIRFDVREHTLGKGMKTNLRVIAAREDGSETTITDDVVWAVSPAGVVSLITTGDAAGTITALADGVATLQATDPVRGLNTQTTGAAKITVAGDLVELRITSNPFRVAVAEDRNASAIGILSSGKTTAPLRKTLTWKIGNTSFATVGTGNNAGIVTGRAIGTTTLMATEPATGVQSILTPLEVRGAIKDISVEPTTVKIGRGMNFQMEAFANRVDGTRSNITESADWQVSPAGIVTIAEGEQNGGLVTALADGTVTIVAVEPKTGKSSATTNSNGSLTVSGNLVALHVTPNPLTIPATESRKAQAIGTLSTGGETSDLRSTVTWSVANTQIATVSNGGDPGLEIGEVVAGEGGTTTLRAVEPTTHISSPETDNLRVQGTVIGVAMEAPDNGFVPIGQLSQFKARATFDDGTTGNISDKCDWSVADTSIATVDNQLPGKGAVTGILFGGQTTVHASCCAFSVQGNVTVIGNQTGLRIDPSEYLGAPLRTRQFRAYGMYDGGFEIDLTSESNWLSTNPLAATVDNVQDIGQVKLVADGQALIVATSPSGHSASSTVTVNGGVVGLSISPPSRVIHGSTWRRFAATGQVGDRDDETNLTKAVTWSSSNENIVRFPDPENQPGWVVGGTQEGTATITATYPNAPPATAEVTVSGLLTALRARPEQRSLKVGKQRRVVFRGSFSDGTEGFMGAWVDLTSSDPGVVEILDGPPGEVDLIRAVSPGQAVISARDPVSGIVSTTNLTVNVTQ